MGLVYDACNGGVGAGAKNDEAQGCPTSHDQVDQADTFDQVDQRDQAGDEPLLNRQINRNDGIRDLFPEMESACRLRDGEAGDEFAEESLFSRICCNAIGPVGRERIRATAYGGVLLAIFIGAFFAGVRFLAIDWEQPAEVSAWTPSPDGPGAAVASTIGRPTERLIAPAERVTATAPAQPATRGTVVSRPAPAPAPGPANTDSEARSVAPRPRGGATVSVDGIVRWTGAKPIAIINGVTVEPGDTVEGYTVMAIDAQGVLLLSGGELFYVPLRQAPSLPA